MTLREYKARLALLPPEWDDLEVQNYDGDFDLYYSPDAPCRETLKLASYGDDDIDWYRADRITDPNAPTKTIVRLA